MHLDDNTLHSMEIPGGAETCTNSICAAKDSTTTVPTQSRSCAGGTIEFSTAKLRGLPARFEAQKIAFGPVVFQCVRIAWKSGLLAHLDKAGKVGASLDEIVATGLLKSYAATVLLETALTAGVVRRQDNRYLLTRIGENVLHDELTQINIDYVHDVCYQGLFALEESLREEKPLGLQALGDWPTLYEGLATLSEPARTSWFKFDHYYSDSAFAQALPHVFARRPGRVMDIGANTGKWTLHCLQHEATVRLTLLDLPGQLEQARLNLQQAGLLERADLHPIDILDYDAPFPGDMDAIWMSQFLTCFGLEAIGHIFRRAAASLADGGSVWVLDTFWDRQAHEIASYCVINTSPYFSAIASGNSKMYESDVIIGCAAASGLKLADAIDGLGISHSLLRFERTK
ncbi:SAM-dependent methyltransferase [Azoarcus taiwanensis]|uniref:Methyltransferase domain-containing protein n=1 Tax=Azoarcus taiwanensis TaxID=666964 RepID=A0A972F859_9RHOO|nr:class I SAM-dependent methyltransferase [Azoarcus taiwanensis]NMG03748.1 methyltransferase domain-containing protein [Azoarcus taiwanensis]